ncbi:hypothetical protein [Streptomyces sp. NPDC054863]
MEAVYTAVLLAVLVVMTTWWLLASIAAGFAISLGITIARHGTQTWCEPGFWKRLGIASALACTAAVGYGMSTMQGLLKLDADDPCTADDDLDDLMGDHPMMDWPLSDTSCGYESVPDLVNPAICVFAILFCASLIAMSVTLITSKRKPTPEPEQLA